MMHHDGPSTVMIYLLGMREMLWTFVKVKRRFMSQEFFFLNEKYLLLFHHDTMYKLLL